jgi:hypothetical protein
MTDDPTDAGQGKVIQELRNGWSFRLEFDYFAGKRLPAGNESE